MSREWQSDAARYRADHRRVERLRGRPQQCDTCGLADPEQRYDWANLTGNYADPTDYKRLCRPCHGAYDAAERKRAGRRNASRHREAIEREYGKPVEQLIEEWRTGRQRLSDRQIALRLGMSEQTIRRWRVDAAAQPAPAAEEQADVA